MSTSGMAADAISSSDLKSLLFPTSDHYLLPPRDYGLSRVRDISGKPVVIICSWGPPSDSSLRAMRNLVLIYNAMSKSYEAVEFVLAVLASNESDFNEFVTSYPFLAIPYEFRDVILAACDQARIPTDSYHGFCRGFLFFDKEGNRTSNDSTILVRYGTDCYPFTKDIIKGLMDDRHDFMDGVYSKGCLSLESLFCCSSDDDASDLGLTKPDGTHVCHTLSTLTDGNTNVVALYQCYDGNFMEELHEVYKECKSEGNDNLVVLVMYFPFDRPADEDLASFFDRMKDKMASLGITDWFVFPFGDVGKVSRKLSILYFHFGGDMVTVVDLKGKYVDPDGKELIHYYGSKAFPFTEKHVLGDVMARLLQITLNDLVPSGSELTDREGRVFTLSELLESGKIILVHHNYGHTSDSLAYHLKCLIMWYRELGKRYHKLQFQVILVGFSGSGCKLKIGGSSFDVFFAKTPWLVAPCRKRDMAIVYKKIGRALMIKESIEGGGFKGPNIFAFMDGKVHSLHAEKYLSRLYFPTKDDVLESEVMAMLEARHDRKDDLLQPFRTARSTTTT